MFSDSPLVHCAQWLDEHALADDHMAKAYESLGGQGRAVLKKCIARLHRLWGEATLRRKCTRRFARDFCLEEDDAPVLYALIVCDAFYQSPAALLACVMPAVLAGVRHIIPCFIMPDGGPRGAVPEAALLAALELSGVERAFAASGPDAEKLLAALSEECGQGRLVILGRPPLGRNLALMAHEQGMVCRFLTQPLRYYNQRLQMSDVQEFGRSARKKAGQDCPDDAMSEADLARIFLHLDERHEDVWVWPDLSPEWFRARQMRLYSG